MTHRVYDFKLTGLMTVVQSEEMVNLGGPWRPLRAFRLVRSSRPSAAMIASSPFDEVFSLLMSVIVGRRRGMNEEKRLSDSADTGLDRAISQPNRSGDCARAL